MILSEFTLADQIAHLVNQGGQFAIDVYETVHPTGYNIPVSVIVLIVSFVSCLAEMALEIFHPVLRERRVHDADIRRLEEAQVEAVREPLPLAQGTARLAGIATWLPEIPDLSALSLPTTPSPAHSRDEENQLEITEQTGSELVKTDETSPEEDENDGAIELTGSGEEEEG